MKSKNRKQACAQHFSSFRSILIDLAKLNNLPTNSGLKGGISACSSTHMASVSGATLTVTPMATLRCYAFRYPDIMNGFCNSPRNDVVDGTRCDLSKLDQHYMVKQLQRESTYQHIHGVLPCARAPDCAFVCVVGDALLNMGGLSELREPVWSDLTVLVVLFWAGLVGGSSWGRVDCGVF